MIVLDLKPMHENRKSYYGKAKVIIEKERVILQSYNTFVCQIDKEGNFEQLWDGYSRTTARHIAEFKKQFMGGNIDV